MTVLDEERLEKVENVVLGVAVLDENGLEVDDGGLEVIVLDEKRVDP